MKRLTLILVFCLATMLAFSQPSAQISLGASSQKYAVGELSLQYSFQPVVLQAGYLASLTRNVNGGTYINFTGGLHLYVSESVFIEPAAGYAYILKSTDQKELNSKDFLASAAIGKDVGDGSLVLKAAYSNSVAMVLVCMRVNF